MKQCNINLKNFLYDEQNRLMFEQYPDHKPLDSIQTDIKNFWRENEIPLQATENRKHSKPFVFYEGPPSANGLPGIHHVVSRTIKDIFCRYKTMQGFYVERKAGWDTHGLPVELGVEKSLGITKEDVGKKISIKDYNAKCRETVMKYKRSWDALTEAIGYWIDTTHPYVTCDNAYIESLWCLLKKLYDKNLLYKGHTIQPYSPAAGTGLSSHELNQPGCYRMVKSTTITAQFKIKGTSNDYFIAWTTTPWTLPANSALAVNENVSYVKVKTFNQYTSTPTNVILAEDAVPRYFESEETVDDGVFNWYVHTQGSKHIPWKIVEKISGKKLLNVTYEQLLPYVTPQGEAFKVIPADFVTTTDGTGIVHIAPTFGADDMRVAKKNHIPSILVFRENGTAQPIVDRNGRFVKEITDFAGLFVKEEFCEESERNNPNYKSVDTLIGIKLKEENKAFSVKKHEHAYPHCWRTDKPVIYYPMDSWFIKTTTVKERMVELNKTINWIPKSVGEGRFGNWLENLVDWNLSRDRFWGTPLPIWRTADGLEEICIGSIDELKAEITRSIAAGFMQKPLNDGFDLHRPYVDEIILASTSGKPMHREPSVIDVWFDSGAMPYAQWHYPFENLEKFQKNFPAQFIAEGIDQTRGWFFTLHALGVLLHDRVAFENVLVNGLVLDKNGVKMSKRLGNTIDPFETIEKYGPDAVRWYIVSNANISENIKFDIAGVEEVVKKFLGTLENTYRFFILYANIDKYEGSSCLKGKNRTTLEIDHWILSRLNHLIKDVTTAYENYNIREVARLVQDFTIDDLSNWYVRLNRKRFWVTEETDDKKIVYNVLYTCLLTIAKLVAPVIPFCAENLYKNLLPKDLPASVHLVDFPSCESSALDMNLEGKMSRVQTIVSLAHSIRKKKNIKVRQPLTKIIVPYNTERAKKEIESLQEVIKAEVNVKNVELISNMGGTMTRTIKPNFKTIPKEYATCMQEIIDAIKNFSQNDINALENKGYASIVTKALGAIALPIECFIISNVDIPGMSIATHNDITIALDTTKTEELILEGIAREIVNRVQNLRKTNGFDVQDKISLEIYTNNESFKKAITVHKEYLCNEVQAALFSLKENLQAQENFTKIEIENISIYFRLSK